MKFFRFAPRRPSELNGPWIFSFLSSPSVSTTRHFVFNYPFKRSPPQEHCRRRQFVRSLAELRNLSFSSSHLLSVARILNRKVLPGDISFFFLCSLTNSNERECAIEERYDLRKVFWFLHCNQCCFNSRIYHYLLLIFKAYIQVILFYYFCFKIYSFLRFINSFV